MGKLRPINATFQLSTNKTVNFSMLSSKPVLLSNDNTNYGYAADIAFIDLYCKEIMAIQSPTITYSQIDNYGVWLDGLKKLKGSVAIWNDTVVPAIIAIPEKLDKKYDDIHFEFKEIEKSVKYVIESLENQEDAKHYINTFNNHLKHLKNEINNENQIFSNFINMLTNQQYRLKDENAKLKNLSTLTIKLTDDQQKQIDKISKQIKDYEDSRKKYIAGAVATGVLAGAAIAGGITAIFLVPGVGLFLGIAAIFGGSILATGTIICSLEAEQLKKSIEALKNNKDNVEKEKIAMAVIAEQFDDFEKRTVNLLNDLQDIINNWNCVSNVIDNIKEKVDEITQITDMTTIDDWKKIENDIQVLDKIVNSLNEAIETMKCRTYVYTDCDVSGCTTEEEILNKLQEYVKDLKQQQ